MPDNLPAQWRTADRVTWKSDKTGEAPQIDPPEEEQI